MFRKTIYRTKKMLDARGRMSGDGFTKSLFENSKKSPTATNIIAYGETIGQNRIIQPLAESEQHFALIVRHFQRRNAFIIKFLAILARL